MAAPGDLDPGFGTGGEVVTSFTPLSASLEDVTKQVDGKLVLVGALSDPNILSPDALLHRYNPDGSLDATFGTGGKVVSDYGDTCLRLVSVPASSTS